MKRILLFVLATLTVSCSDFLTVQPTDFLTEDSYYKKKEHFEAALVSVYDVLGQGGYYAREKMITGPQVYNFSSSDEIIEAMWKACYLGINRANELLSRIDDADIDEPVKNRIKGEALFLRAYYYFLLVQYWGDVPLLLKPTRSTDHLDVARTSKDLVYDRILRDMKEAESLVDGIENIGYGGRVSRSAVRGILARVWRDLWGQDEVSGGQRLCESRYGR